MKTIYFLKKNWGYVIATLLFAISYVVYKDRADGATLADYTAFGFTLFCGLSCYINEHRVTFWLSIWSLIVCLLSFYGMYDWAILTIAIVFWRLISSVTKCYSFKDHCFMFIITLLMTILCVFSRSHELKEKAIEGERLRTGVVNEVYHSDNILFLEGDNCLYRISRGQHIVLKKGDKISFKMYEAEMYRIRKLKK